MASVRLHRHTTDYTFCPLCGGEIDHGAEVRFARGQGFVSRFGRIVRLSSLRMRIFIELMMRFPKTIGQERFEYLLYDDDEISVRAIDAIVCMMNKELAPLGIRAKKKNREWSLYFASREEVMKIPYTNVWTSHAA